MQNLVYQLFNSEIEHWQLAKEKYAELEQSVSKNFDLDDFSVEAVCNPARIRSTLANVKQHIEKLRNSPEKVQFFDENCFLCADIRPKEQQSVDVNDFQILINPYPIFPKHFTITHKQHTPQLIMPYFADFLHFAKKLPDFAIFYNGANCGASAPHHAHFQAAEKQYFNVISDYKNLPENYFEIIEKKENFTLKAFKNYLRNAFCIETENEKTAQEIFEKHFANYIKNNMLNVICVYENCKYLLFIFPRKKFRPTQFYEENEEKRLAISPASVEMSGKFVTIFQEHFDRISKEDIIDIYKQISI